MFDKYPAGYDLTLLDCRYTYPKLKENGKWDNGHITLIAKDNVTGKKVKEIIKNPSYTYQIVKDEVIKERNITYQLKSIETSCCTPRTVPYKDLEKDIAEQIGEINFYYDNLKNRNRSANRMLHMMNPKIMMSDINIEDYYRFRFSNKFQNQVVKINKAFLDIEADTRFMKGDFPEPGECPINVITLINLETNDVYTLMLRNHDNPQIEQFENELKQGKIIPEFKNLLMKHVNGWKNIHRYRLQNFKYHMGFYDEDKEINLIADMFRIINQLQPDFLLVWNMAFDIPYIIQRIINLGYDPAEIMCHPDFKDKECRYFIDTRTELLEERGDLATISSYTVYLDQMLIYAGIRKGRGSTPKNLDYVTGVTCHFGKLDYSHITQYISELPYLDYKTFIFYNIIDVIDQVCVEEKVKDIDLVFAKALINNTRYNKIFRQTVYLMNRRTKFYWDRGLVCGNNVNKMNKKPDDKFAGAFVAASLQITDVPKMKLNGVPVMIFNNLDDYDYLRLYPTMLQEFNLTDETQIGKLYLANEQIHDKENLSKADSKLFSREGSFFDDYAAKNFIEFAHRWFGLADFSELIDDVEEYFTQVQAPMVTGINFMDRNGFRKMYTKISENIRPAMYVKIYDAQPVEFKDSFREALTNVYSNNIGFEIKGN